jgi:hypothetical protein
MVAGATASRLRHDGSAGDAGRHGPKLLDAARESWAEPPAYGPGRHLGTLCEPCRINCRCLNAYFPRRLRSRAYFPTKTAPQARTCVPASATRYSRTPSEKRGARAPAFAKRRPDVATYPAAIPPGGSNRSAERGSARRPASATLPGEPLSQAPSGASRIRHAATGSATPLPQPGCGEVHDGSARPRIDPRSADLRGAGIRRRTATAGERRPFEWHDGSGERMEPPSCGAAPMPDSATPTRTHSVPLRPGVQRGEHAWRAPGNDRGHGAAAGHEAGAPLWQPRFALPRRA